VTTVNNVQCTRKSFHDTALHVGQGDKTTDAINTNEQQDQDQHEHN